MTYDKCPRCSHTWHGLPCAVQTSPLLDAKHTPHPCACPSPFDDDYWQKDDVA